MAAIRSAVSASATALSHSARSSRRFAAAGFALPGDRGVCRNAAGERTPKRKTNVKNLISKRKNLITKLPFIRPRPILGRMTELDEVWAEMLGSAAQKAAAAGRHHLADYLRLKATNDAIRTRGVSWLFDTAVEIGTSVSLPYAPVSIERFSPHAFKRGTSNMAGSRLVFRQGVRCLAVEAGWTRTPSDGIMTGAALAFARLLHFGMPRNDAEFRLVRGTDLPEWIDHAGIAVDTVSIRRHFNIFLA